MRFVRVEVKDDGSGDMVPYYVLAEDSGSLISYGSYREAIGHDNDPPIKIAKAAAETLRLKSVDDVPASVRWSKRSDGRWYLCLMAPPTDMAGPDVIGG